MGQAKVAVQSAKEGTANSAAGAGSSCSYSMDKKTCDEEKGCIWCDCSLAVPARCYDEVSTHVQPSVWGGGGCTAAVAGDRR